MIIDKQIIKQIANNIYLKTYGEPKTHKEWAESFNIKGDLIKIINKEMK